MRGENICPISGFRRNPCATVAARSPPRARALSTNAVIVASRCLGSLITITVGARSEAPFATASKAWPCSVRSSRASRTWAVRAWRSSVLAWRSSVLAARSSRPVTPRCARRSFTALVGLPCRCAAASSTPAAISAILSQVFISRPNSPVGPRSGAASAAVRKGFGNCASSGGTPRVNSWDAIGNAAPPSLGNGSVVPAPLGSVGSGGSKPQMPGIRRPAQEGGLPSDPHVGRCP